MADTVRRRVSSCSDLVTEEARYHRQCRDNFNVASLKCTSTSGRKGRPKNVTQEGNYVKLCNWLEMEEDLYSVAELYVQMKKLAASDEIYSKPQYLKEQLQKNYGNQIFLQL